MNALDYFLKANLYGLLFVSCYWLFLRWHTFFSLNRIYLLSATVLSLVLPLASLPTQTIETIPENWPVPVGIIALPILTIATAPTEITQANPSLDWNQIGLIAYGLIALILVLHLALRIGRLLWLIHQSDRQVHTNYVLAKTPRLARLPIEIPTFSFFRYLVLSPNDTHNELIVKHELVHIRQYHSADVLGMALLRAVFWACPALWFLDRMLRQVHEFLADKEASQPTEYARFLVAYTFGLQPDTLTNGFFNPSLLKLRIQMLHQKTTKRWALGKYALVLPLALGLLAMTTVQEKIATVVSQVTDDTITVTGKVTGADGKPLPGVQIVSKDKKLGTSTNSKGAYVLSNVPKNIELIVSFIGFNSRTIQVKERTVINIVMSSAVALEEVIVTADEPRPTGKVYASSDNTTSSYDEVFTVVEQLPQFPGGIRALSQYLTQNLHYPIRARKASIDGRVFVQFIVTQKGNIEQLRILKGIGFGCDEEAVRVVSRMPKWVPGKQKGKSVSVMYNLPIQFSLEKPEGKRTGQFTPPAQLKSEQIKPEILDNSKNSRFALHNDVTSGNKQRYTMPLPDSLKSSVSSIRIRSNGFSIGDPIYVIDGIESTKDGLDKLNPHDIDSIDVLKGSSATVTYGEKARNGVIQITTKTK